MTLLEDEVRRLLRRAQDVVLMLGFGLIALVLMAVSSDPVRLRDAAPGMIWTVVLFSVLLMIEQIFRHDQASGRLELLLSQPIPRWIILLAKAVGFWLRAGLPLLVSAPLAAVLLQLPFEIVPELLYTLALGTPTLCLLASIGAILTLEARYPVLLIMVLILPLLIPVLIFGTLGLERSLAGGSSLASLLWLGVCLCLALGCIPLGAVAMSRN